MVRIYLQSMAEQLPDLPPSWLISEPAAFSRTKTLWPHQQQAVENAVKVLWKYYDEIRDHQPGKDLAASETRKRSLLRWYQVNGLDEDLSLRPSTRTRSGWAITRLLADYYPIDQGRIPYQPFINRMSFWMATGSGKSLVLIKLLQILHDLIRRGEMPAHDMLILTHRDDLVSQLKAHVEEFNAGGHDLHIHLAELKRYDNVKWGSRSLIRRREMTVFYYRSDNLSDEQKEKIISFRNYDNDGQWYIFLDEAHKGDREESKRQHIYSILSRNGFLFNFSATFADDRDVVTTVYDFNLARFIQQAHGKHILLLKQETRAFKDEEDYTHREKRKVVLKALLMLAYVGKRAEQVRAIDAELYHRPLMLALVNSVNVQDADLKLFFRELERIGQGRVSPALLRQAQAELWDEIKRRPRYLFEDRHHVVDADLFQSLTLGDVWRYVFNAEQGGQIEVLLRPSNRQEIALKLKTADQAFALIKIGDISGWLRDELAGYELNHHFDDESFFEQLNQDHSEINLLMGSRTFYEGWDSNRPNVITFVNIGVGAQAKKFILQSVGRGVRIEPLADQRKRLAALHRAGLVDDDLAAQLREPARALETLCIFGTNRQALKAVLEYLDRESRPSERQQRSVPVDEAARQKKALSFALQADELEMLQSYLDYLDDPRLLVARHDVEPALIQRLRDSLAQDSFERNGRPVGNLDLLMNHVIRLLSATASDCE